MKIMPIYVKTIGIIILCIPIVLLLILGIGEVAGGILSGTQHFLQVIPLLVVAVIAWRYPKIGGCFLLVIAIIFAVVYSFIMYNRFPLWALLINELLLFLPAILSGVLILISNKNC